MSTRNWSRRAFLDSLVQGTGQAVQLPELTKQVVKVRERLAKRTDQALDELAEARRLSWEDAQTIRLD